jgi:hypothetical protein
MPKRTGGERTAPNCEDVGFHLNSGLAVDIARLPLRADFVAEVVGDLIER